MSNEVNNINESTFTIKYRQGENILEKIVTYDEERLSLFDEMRLKKENNPMKYMQIDPEKYDEFQERLQNLKDPSKRIFPPMKSFDMAGMTIKQLEINIELARILFGLTDINEKDIIASSFRPLIALIEKKDPLKIVEEAKEIQKKVN